MFQYRRLTSGPISANTYILYDDVSLEAAVIDAGNEVELVERAVADLGVTVKYIVLTHAHYDHICCYEEYSRAFVGAESVIHEADDHMLDSPRLNCSAIFGPEEKYAHPTRLVKEGDAITLGGETAHILHTPGHTPGGICIMAEPYIFTGDTLFCDGFGRTDLGAGSTPDLCSSIERLYSLEPELIVLPGHGTKTTIGREAANNPFLDF